MKNIKIYLWVLLTVTLWGTSFAITKIGITNLNPVHFLFLRVLFSSIIFGFSLMVIPKSKKIISLKDLYQLIILSFIGISGYFIVQYSALKYTTAVNASLLIAISPIFIALYMHFSKNELINKLQGYGILISFLGVCLIITNGKINGLFSNSSVIGDGLMIINAGMLAIFTIRAKYLLKKYDPFVLIAYMNISALITLIPIVFTNNFISKTSLLNVIGGIESKAYLAALYLAIFCTVIGYYGWYKGIKELGASRTSVFNYLNPLVATITSNLLLHEGMTTYTFLGSLLAISGLLINNKFKSDNSKKEILSSTNQKV